MPHAQIEGTRIFYDTAGDRGPPILLIQGVGCLGQTWRPQIDDLCRDHRVAWFDNRGIGGSDPLRGPLSIEQMAQDALALLSHLGWGSAHLMGHSMGGVIAQQAALCDGARVRSLVLAATLFRGRDVIRLQPRALWPMIRGQIGGAAGRRQAFCDLIFPRAWQDQVGRAQLQARLQALYGRDVTEPLPIVNRQLAALRAHDASARLKTLTMPALVVKADLDLIIHPRQSDELAARLPKARLLRFPSAGHGLTVQCPDEFNDAVRAHVADAEAAARRA